MAAPDVEDQIVAIGSILVIDDHPLYCDALAAALPKIVDVHLVRSANSLAEGLKLVCGRAPPDLVILDLRLPDVTGLSGFLKLKETAPDTPVLVISADSSCETIQMLMDAGAAGFVAKDASQATFRDALGAVRRGLKYLPGGFRRTRTAEAAEAANAPTVQEISRRIADLTPQQGRIMTLICAGKPNKQIAYEMSLAEATVKAHITALLRRLGVNNRTQAAVLVNRAKLEREPTISDTDARALLS